MLLFQLAAELEGHRLSRPWAFRGESSSRKRSAYESLRDYALSLHRSPVQVPRAGERARPLSCLSGRSVSRLRNAPHPYRWL